MASIPLITRGAALSGRWDEAPKVHERVAAGHALGKIVLRVEAE